MEATINPKYTLTSRYYVEGWTLEMLDKISKMINTIDIALSKILKHCGTKYDTFACLKRGRIHFISLFGSFKIMLYSK